jgi:thiol-disulfide isomerase/thioredoxin
MRNLLAIILLFGVTGAFATTGKQIIFFFDSTCPYCQEMAPIILKVAKKYKLPVVGNSLDGKPIKGFPHALANMKLAKIFQIQGLPTVGGVDYEHKQLSILVRGAQNESQFEQVLSSWVKGEETNAFAK